MTDSRNPDASCEEADDAQEKFNKWLEAQAEAVKAGIREQVAADDHGGSSFLCDCGADETRPAHRPWCRVRCYDELKDAGEIEAEFETDGMAHFSVRPRGVIESDLAHLRALCRQLFQAEYGSNAWAVTWDALLEAVPDE